MIELQSLTKMYGRVIGVNDVTLTLEPGAYGLLGPNGSGKTTLLNLLTGQLRPTIGDVRVLGQNPLNNSTLHSQIGYCPGSEGLYSNVSGFQWVQYLVQMYGYSRNASEEMAADALALVGMTESMHRSIAQYSRGMRQRVKLAQGIAHNPELLILDEPFNGLDPVGRHDLMNVLRDWITLGKSLVIASHVLYEIEAITKSFLLINNGRLLASGVADDVHEMMDDTPTEVRIRCNLPRKLGQSLLGESFVERIGLEADDRTMVVSTRSHSRLFSRISDLARTSEIEIQEMRTDEESLQAVFNALMRIHRGER